MIGLLVLSVSLVGPVPVVASAGSGSPTSGLAEGAMGDAWVVPTRPGPGASFRSVGEGLESSTPPDGDEVATPGSVAAVAALGVERIEVTPVAGAVDPFSGREAAGAIVEVPDGASMLVVEATVTSSFAVRLRSDRSWEPWHTLGAEDDEAPDGAAGARRGLGPLPLGDGTTDVELIQLRGPDEAIVAAFLPGDDDAEPTVGASGRGPLGSSAAIPAVLRPLVPHGDDSERGSPLAVAASAVATRAALAVPARPPIVARSQWAGAGWAFDTPGCERGPSQADNLQAIVIHHTVTSNSYGRDQVDDLLRGIYYSHVVVNGWCDIGYNFVVDRFGTIWEARSGGIDRPVIGGHAKGFNTSTAGIALLGQHHPGARPTSADTTAAADAAVEALASWKLGLHGVDPTGTTWLHNSSFSGAQRFASGHWHLVPTIVGHRELGYTSCPGNHGMALVDALGPALDDGHPGDRPYTHPGWAPADVGSGFVTIDARGGLRPAGSATIAGIGAPSDPGGGPLPLPPPGVRAVAARRAGSTVAGYVLGVDGTLHPFGSSPAAGPVPLGGADAVDLALGSSGGWVVTDDGRVIGFGGRPDRSPAGGSRPIVGASLDENGDGHLVDADGRTIAVGAAPDAQTDVVAGGGTIQAVDLAHRQGGGGWVLDGSGRLHPFGGAPAVGARPWAGSGHRAVAVVAAPGGIGGWVVTADGQLWPFGDARLVPAALTDTSASDVVDGAVLDPVVSSAFAASDVGRYLSAVVELFLGRPPTAADYDHWEGRYTYGGGRSAVTEGLARSEEWAGQRIDVLYRDVLGRSADAEGRRYWLDAMVDGLPLNQVGIHFYGSSEYVAQAGSTAAYVDRLYQVLLGRSADGGGRAYWTGELSAGRASPADVVAGFYASDESRRSRVIALYRDVLGRDPDAGGLGYWAQELLVRDDVELAALLAASAEFHDNAVG